MFVFRVLRPPGGGSSNIFGDPEPVAPKQQVQQEIAQQSPAAQQTQSPANPTADAKNEYQKNKPKGKGMSTKILDYYLLTLRLTIQKKKFCYLH